MSANNKYTNNEFDKLMQDAFLDLDTGNPENSALLDEVAKSVYATEWAGVSDRHNAAAATKNNKIAMWAWFLSDVIIVIGVGIFGWNVLGSTKVKAETKAIGGNEVAVVKESSEFGVQPVGSRIQRVQSSANSKDETAVTVEKKEVIKQGNEIVIANSSKKKLAEQTKVKDKTPLQKEIFPEIKGDDNLKGTTLGVAKKEDVPAEDKIITQKQENTEQPSITNENTEENSIPEFTEAETKEHLEAKEKFILSFTGMKKTEFALVDMAGEANGHRFLKTNEVSNFEYNMFLNDLILKGKTKEYEIAKHKNEKLYAGKDEVINKVFLNRYLKKSKYESEHKYKYYPVVCVSVEGMEMYCAWLKEQIQEYYKHNDQNVTVTVRLPKTEEWQTAALNGDTKRKYATYNGKLTDEAAKSKWLANFVQTQNSYVSGDENILLNRSDKNKKIKPTTLGKNMFTISSVTGDGKDTKSETYALQNMSGNVSEVVIDNDEEGNKKYRTIGGNWNSKKKFLLIQSSDEFKGKTEPSIYVGFRPIVILEP